MRLAGTSVTTRRKKSKIRHPSLIPIASSMIDNLITVSVSGRGSLSLAKEQVLVNSVEAAVFRDHFSVACDVKIQMTRDRRLG